MKTYLITYDLNKEGAQYNKAKEQIEKAIKTLGDTIHVVTTIWLVKTNQSTDTIQKSLKNATDSNDHFLFTQLCSQLNGWLPEEKNKWIQSAPKCCTY